jgi:hypothetical protein
MNPDLTVVADVPEGDGLTAQAVNVKDLDGDGLNELIMHMNTTVDGVAVSSIILRGDRP